MHNQPYSTLWKITLLVAIGLLIATFILAFQVLRMPQTVFIAHLIGPNPTIYLRAEPSAGSNIVTILERGSTVYVMDTVTSQDIRWMKIEFGQFIGWIPEANLSFENQ